MVMNGPGLLIFAGGSTALSTQALSLREGFAASGGGLNIHQMVGVSMNDFPISVLKTEDCCDAQGHRPSLWRVGKANFCSFNI
jgi:hypothetical protein